MVWSVHVLIMGRTIYWMGLQEPWEGWSTLPLSCQHSSARLSSAGHCWRLLLPSSKSLRVCCIPLPRPMVMMFNRIDPMVSPEKTAKWIVNYWPLSIWSWTSLWFPAYSVVHSACPYFHLGCNNTACQKPCKRQDLFHYCFVLLYDLHIFNFLKHLDV